MKPLAPLLPIRNERLDFLVIHAESQGWGRCSPREEQGRAIQ